MRICFARKPRICAPDTLGQQLREECYISPSCVVISLLFNLIPHAPWEYRRKVYPEIEKSAGRRNRSNHRDGADGRIRGCEVLSKVQHTYTVTRQVRREKCTRKKRFIRNLHLQGNISAQITPHARYSSWLGRIPCKWESRWYRVWNVFAIRCRMAPPAARWSRAAFLSLSSDMETICETPTWL